MDSSQFISSVWKWKYAASFSWSLIVFIVFLIFYRFTNFIFNIKTKLYLPIIAMIFIPLENILYYRCLTIVPKIHSILTMKEFLQRCAWFFTHWLWNSIVLMPLCKIRAAFFLGFILSYFLVNTITFSVYIQQFVIARANRKDRLEILKGTYTFPVIPIIVLTIVGVFSFSFNILVIAIALYLVSDIILRIIEIIAGEPVSFTSTSSKRLIDGLKSTGLVKYWAYTDFLLAALDDCSQRREILFDTKDNLFQKLILTIKDDLSEYANRFFDFYDPTDDGRLNISQINNATLTVSEKGNRLVNRIVSTKIYQQIKARYRRYQSRTTKKYNESRTIYNSFFVIEAVRALDALIELAPREDKYGLLQAQSEVFVNQLLTVFRSINDTNCMIFALPPFNGVVKRYNDQPIYENSQVLTNFVRRYVYDTLSAFISKYGSSIDTGRISKANMIQFNVFLNQQ